MSDVTKRAIGLLRMFGSHYDSVRVADALEAEFATNELGYTKQEALQLTLQTKCMELHERVKTLEAELQATKPQQLIDITAALDGIDRALIIRLGGECLSASMREGVAKAIGDAIRAAPEPQWLDKPTRPGPWVRRAKDGFGGYELFDITRSTLDTTAWTNDYWWLAVPTPPAVLPRKKQVTLTARYTGSGVEVYCDRWLVERIDRGTHAQTVEFCRATYGIEPAVVGK